MPTYILLEGKNHTEWIPDKDKPDDPKAGRRVKLKAGDRVNMTEKRAANLKDRFVPVVKPAVVKPAVVKPAAK